jgi:hypothetical protein
MIIDDPRPFFSHRTVSQFVQQKADDGTLAQMAGPGFDPLLADQYLFLGLSRYCRDLKDFAQLMKWILKYEVDWEGAVENNAPLVEQIIPIALALDRIGQQITRPPHQAHWTINQLNKYEPRLPLDCKHSTLMSYLLSRNAESEVLVGVFLELQSHSTTDGQKKFMLESAFIRGLYIVNEGLECHWPQKMIIELIKTLTDVNEPSRQVRCSLDYSPWQIFLLWLHEHNHWYCYHENGDVTEVCQTFLSYGADLCAVVSGKDLANRGYANGCTLSGNEALVSATELLEDINKHVCNHAADMKGVHTKIDCAQTLHADATHGSSQHR